MYEYRCRRGNVVVAEVAERSPQTSHLFVSTSVLNDCLARTSDCAIARVVRGQQAQAYSLAPPRSEPVITTVTILVESHILRRLSSKLHYSLSDVWAYLILVVLLHTISEQHGWITPHLHGMGDVSMGIMLSTFKHI